MKRPYTFFPVGALLGATVATLVVWYYNRKISGSQEAEDAPSKASKKDSLSAPTVIPKADSMSTHVRTSHMRLPVNPPSDATSSDNISRGSVVTASNTFQEKSGKTSGDSISTTSTTVPSDIPTEAAVAISDGSLPVIYDTALDENISTASVVSPGGIPLILFAGSPSHNSSPVPASIPVVGPNFTRRTSERSESSQQQFNTACVSSSREARAWLAEPHCVVEAVAGDRPVQEVVIAIKQTTFDLVEEKYKTCQSLLMNSRRPLQVAVIIDSRDDWSLTSLKQISQALICLTKDDKERLCKTLTVKLPKTDELESNAGVADLVLPEVISLNWESHAHQLPLIGLGNFTHLSNLEVRSRLSFRDCQLLLQCASETLESCRIAQVIDNSGSTYAFSKEICTAIELGASNPIVMRKLASLSIDSVLCPGEMLRKFRYRSLKVLELSVHYDFDPERNMNSIPWVGLEEVYMNCHFVHGGAAWVEKSTPNATMKKISSIRNPGV